MDLFDYQTNYDLGHVGRTSSDSSTFLEARIFENDVYQFTLGEAGDLNVSLHNLSHGDDADLELYRDSNGNGILDANDELIDNSNSVGDSDDSIRYDAAAGDYFTRVYYFDGGHDEIINYDLTLFTNELTAEDLFPYQTDYDLGYLERTNIDRSTFLSEGVYEHDVYQFSFGETSDLEISLHSFGTDDDADLELYRDVNHNNVLDTSDELIGSSVELAGSDDSIDYDGAIAGTYFAHVNYYSGGADGYLDYELSLSADNHVNNDNRFEYQTNFDLGHVGRTPTETSLFLEAGLYENDAYQVTLGEGGDLNISLHSLSHGDDADLELYRDVNHNNVLDTSDELLIGSSNFGDGDEFILYEDLTTGSYFANVSYYDGGHDGLIDYSLSVSSEADETIHHGGSQGQLIVGSDDADFLTGTGGNDTIRGHYSSDQLSGGAGDDILNGSYDANEITTQVYLGDSAYNEHDVLTGGDGADIFVLGHEHGSNYQDYGYDDYATITDFDWYEGDTIQVYGVAEDYSIAPFNGGIDIYYQSELIGYVENTTDVIIEADFTFV